MEVPLTAEVHREGEWFVAFCPEFPEANGQGQTQEECIASLREAILLLMEDRREDDRSRTGQIKNPHDGTTLDDFLREEGIFEEVEAAALKRALALNIADLMRKKRVRKSTMAKQMHTSRAALDRLLDPSNTSVTLATLNRAAKALGRKIKIDLVPA